MANVVGYVYTSGDEVREQLQKQSVTGHARFPDGGLVHVDGNTRVQRTAMFETLADESILIVQSLEVLADSLEDLEEIVHVIWAKNLTLIETSRISLLEPALDFHRNDEWRIDWCRSLIRFCAEFRNSASSRASRAYNHYERLLAGSKTWPTNWKDVFYNWNNHHITTTIAAEELGVTISTFKTLVLAASAKTSLQRENIIRLWPRWGTKVFENETVELYIDWNRGAISTKELAAKLEMSISSLYMMMQVFETINIDLVSRMISDGTYRIIRVVNRERKKPQKVILPENATEILQRFANGNITKAMAAETLKVSPSSIYRLAFERGVSKEK